MKEKKTTIITVRTSERIREELEVIAAEKQWSISQLAEQIIADYLNPADAQITQNEEADVIKLLDLIEAQGKIDRQKLIRIAAENNLLSTLRGMGVFTDGLIKEHNEKITQTNT